MKRALLALLVGATGCLTGCGAGSAVSHYGTVIEGAVGTTTRVEVTKGQRFSLAVPDNPSVGDNWDLVELPDPKVASYISEEYESGGEAPGSGGTGYFVFNAKWPGTTEVRLFNCWRCSDRAKATPESGEAIFSVTVNDTE